MEVGIIIIGLILFFGIAELFGRRKHIGRWWSFGLLATGLIIGIIAIITSPNAKEKPTQGSSSHQIFGWICIGFGVLALIKFNPVSLGLILLGIYLMQLSQGKIINNDPKDYFKKSTKRGLVPPKFEPTKNVLYFLLVDGQQSEAFTFEDLKKKRLRKSDLVWRKGLENWVQAEQIDELLELLAPEPPKLNSRILPPPYNKKHDL